MEEKYISINFESSNKHYTFKTSDESIKLNDYVVVETQRGLDIGIVCSDFFDKPNTDTEIKEIIRKATEQDITDYKDNIADSVEAKSIAQEEADKLNLGMNFISCDFTLDRSKVSFSYLADERVDFRELLKILASIFHCRIDLRQVGTRDKAKMVSGIGMCGRKLCCSNYMSEFERISINMAKNQLLALNVQKLSGQCGNLMCCLKYEDEAYKELRNNLPKVNSIIEFQGEKYRLTSMNVISKNCKLENEEHSINVKIDELNSFGKVIKNNNAEEDEEVIINEK